MHILLKLAFQHFYLFIFLFLFTPFFLIHIFSCQHFMLVDAFAGLDNFIELSIIYYLSGNSNISNFFKHVFHTQSKMTYYLGCQ